LRRAIEGVQRAVHAVADAAREDGESAGASVNVAHRVNAVITANIGEPGATNLASTHQHAPIRQGRRSPARESGSTHGPGGESIDEA